MICGELSSGSPPWFCTLEPAHAGCHVAEVFGSVVDTWADYAEPDLDCSMCGGELVVLITEPWGLDHTTCFCAPPLSKDEESAIVSRLLARLDAA